eukprot:8834993-Alexandrium_andersonii.AAC.1
MEPWIQIGPRRPKGKGKGKECAAQAHDVRLLRQPDLARQAHLPPGGHSAIPLRAQRSGGEAMAADPTAAQASQASAAQGAAGQELHQAR